MRARRATLVLLASATVVAGPATAATASQGASAVTTAEFGPACREVTVASTKDLSNVVLRLDDGRDVRFEDLSGRRGTFAVGSEPIVTVWVKSGSNHSGDGPGYGERHDAPARCASTTPPAGPSEGSPTDGGTTPGSGAGTPTDGGTTPGSGSGTPSDGGTTPGSGSGTPSEGSSGDGGTTPGTGSGSGAPSAGAPTSGPAVPPATAPGTGTPASPAAPAVPPAVVGGTGAGTPPATGAPTGTGRGVTGGAGTVRPATEETEVLGVVLVEPPTAPSVDGEDVGDTTTRLPRTGAEPLPLTLAALAALSAGVAALRRSRAA